MALVLLGCLGVGLLAAIDTAEKPMELPVLQVAGTSWQYGQLGEIEVLTRATAHVTRTYVAALLRGQRLLPDFVQKQPYTTKIIVVSESERTGSELPELVMVDADRKYWDEGYHTYTGRHKLADHEIQVIALNLARLRQIWPVQVDRAKRLFEAQRPEFPAWARHGAFGNCGPLFSVIGIPHSTSVQFPKLSWPDPTATPNTYPSSAADFPDFTEMFDHARDPEKMPQTEKWKFEFQCGLFARWSLFGSTESGRKRHGFWVFAEMARRGKATEEVFKECYLMDWATACAEMQRYLKSDGTGILEVRMPGVMADVPETETLQFRSATPEEAKRILGDFERLRTQDAAKIPPSKI